MTYIPEFKLESRNGATALWVTMPNGAWFNIWDLSSNNVNPEVLSAIKMSFYRGLEAQKQVVERANVARIWDQNEWIDKRMKTNER